MARLGHAPAQIGRRSCVVVVETAPPPDTDAGPDEADSAGDAGQGDGFGESLVVGLLVDAVYEVFDAPPGDYEPVPQLGTRIDAAYLQGMSRVRNEVIGVLALERVLAQKELTALIGHA
jgi:purine-binding chemotaxis protein CheW